MADELFFLSQLPSEIIVRVIAGFICTSEDLARLVATSHELRGLVEEALRLQREEALRLQLLPPAVAADRFVAAAQVGTRRRRRRGEWRGSGGGAPEPPRRKRGMKFGLR